MDHIPGPPERRHLQRRVHRARGRDRQFGTPDTLTGQIRFADLNAGDQPTAKTIFASFAYQNAQHADVTSSLTAEQIAAIQAVEVPLVVVQDPAHINHGTATWTYSIPDGAFDFLAAGETLTLTYVAQVDNNFAPNVEIDVQDVHHHDHRHQRYACHHQRRADRCGHGC